MWRDIKGYEGIYEINEDAVIRRVGQTGSDGRSVSMHVVLSSRTKNGTRYITLWKDGIRKNYMLHKVYATAFQMSKNEAIRRLYRGFNGNGAAIDNVSGMLRENLKVYEKEQMEGLDRNDEILYIRQFLEELQKDLEEKNSYLNENQQRMIVGGNR